MLDFGCYLDPFISEAPVSSSLRGSDEHPRATTVKIHGWFFITMESLSLIMTVHFCGNLCRQEGAAGISSLRPEDTRHSHLSRNCSCRKARVGEKPYGLMHNRSKCLSIGLSICTSVASQVLVVPFLGCITSQAEQ